MAVKGEDDGGSNGSSVADAGLGAFAGDGFEMGIACMVASRVRLPGQGDASGPPRFSRPQAITSLLQFQDNKGDQACWNSWREKWICAAKATGVTFAQ